MPERLIASSAQDVGALASGSIESFQAVSVEQTLNLASGGPEKLIAVATETVSVLGSEG